MSNLDVNCQTSVVITIVVMLDNDLKVGEVYIHSHIVPNVKYKKRQSPIENSFWYIRSFKSVV